MNRYIDYLAENLARQNTLIHMHVDDLSLADTLVQPSGGNNMNWTLGHIAAHREKMLAVAGIDLPWAPNAYARYDRGSEPLVDEIDAVDLAQVVGDLDKSSELLVDWLKSADDAALATPLEGDRRDRGSRLGFLIWHETMHIGHLEPERHLAGYHNSII